MTRHGGGWAAVKYVLDVADRVGWLRMWKAMRTKNTCKTCALGMGGQQGGMRNEAGHWPEVCKKSLQAMASDMQDGIGPDFFDRYGFAELRTLSPRELESAGRIVHPMHAGPDDSHYRTISWPEALRRIAEKLKTTEPAESFFYMSGRSSNEAAFLLQLFARIYGTNHVNNCSYYCHQASGVGLTASIGSGTATVTLEDVENADLFFLIGGNPASNHPRLMRTLMTIRRNGGQVIAINPLREAGLVNFRVPSDIRSLLFGTDIASEYVQPHIGGDIALLTGIAKSLIEGNRAPNAGSMGVPPVRTTDSHDLQTAPRKDAIDHAFINASTEGWHEFRNSIEQTDWQTVVERSGVTREQIEHIAQLYAKSKRAVFGWTMGITHHLHGVDNVRMIVNLALMRGIIGKPGAGLLPIRGHSNVQGIGSVGVTPRLKDAIFEKLQSRSGVKLPTFKGHDTMTCMEAAARGEMKFALCLGGNLFGSNPDAVFAAKALGNIETVVHLNTTLNTGHAWGHGRETIVLPVLARDEEPQTTTQESMFNFVRLSDGGEARHIGPQSEVAIIAALARKVLGDNGPIDWREMEVHRTIRNWIAEIIPGYEKIAEIDSTKKEFHVTGRTMQNANFPTPTGKAHFKAVQIPQQFNPMQYEPTNIEVRSAIPPTNGEHGPPARANRSTDQISEQTQLPLRLMTIRSEGQFNTVVYEDQDLYRGQDRRDIILLSADDMSLLGLRENALVTVRSQTGTMHDILARAFDIRPGNAAMYCPEANILVPRAVDPQSGTPAFKNVAITVEPESITRWEPDGRISLTISPNRPARPLSAC